MTEIWVGILVGAVLAAVGLFVYKLVAERRLSGAVGGDSTVEEIEDAVLPWISQAIMAAFKAAEEGLDMFDGIMDGADKKAIADAVYDMLPSRIGNFNIMLVKQFITRDRFSTMVQNTYDDFRVFYGLHRERMHDLITEWGTGPDVEPVA